MTVTPEVAQFTIENGVNSQWPYYQWPTYTYTTTPPDDERRKFALELIAAGEGDPVAIAKAALRA